MTQLRKNPQATTRRARAVAVFLAGALAGSAGASDVYRCQAPDGRIEFRDQPCPAGAGVKLDVRPNSVGEVDQAKLKAKSEAIDRRIGAKIAADDRDRARQAAATADRNNRCQGYVDEAYRQAAWLSARSIAVQQSASTEIRIQRRRFEAEGCGAWP